MTLFQICVVMVGVFFIGYQVGASVQRRSNRQKQKFDGAIVRTSGGSLSQEQIDSLCEALANIDDAREGCVPGTAVWRELDAVHRNIDGIVGMGVRAKRSECES